MNEYLASPVTPIVISVLAIAISLAVIITVRSKRKKLRKEQERRRMEIRVAQQLEEERRSKERQNRANSMKGQPLRRPRLEDLDRDVPSRANMTGKPRAVKLSDVVTGQAKRDRPNYSRPQRSATSGTGGETRRYDPSTDNMMSGMLIGGIIAPDWSDNDNSSRDSGSTRSDDSGSRDSGTSWSGDSGGGGSWGGSDSGSSSGGSSDSGGSFGGGDSGSF